MTSYPPAPLFAAAARRGVTDDELAARIGLTTNALRGWRRRGRVPERWADDAAVALGVLPGEVWAEWDEQSAAEVDDKEAARRERANAYSAEWKRRMYQADPAARAARLAANRAYKAQARDALRVKDAAYRAANAERRQAARRRRYRENQDAERARQREYDRRKAAERRGVLLHVDARNACSEAS